MLTLILVFFAYSYGFIAVTTPSKTNVDLKCVIFKIVAKMTIFLFRSYYYIVHLK